MEDIMKATIVYWSATGKTEAMAKAIQAGLVAGGADSSIYTVGDFSGDFADSDVVLLGCPAMGAEVLEEDEFQPFWDSVKGNLAGKKVVLFGTYGWGTGEWMTEWVADAAGLDLFPAEGYMVQEDEDYEAAAEEFGKSLV